MFGGDQCAVLSVGTTKRFTLCAIIACFALWNQEIRIDLVIRVSCEIKNLKTINFEKYAGYNSSVCIIFTLQLYLLRQSNIACILP